VEGGDSARHRLSALSFSEPPFDAHGALRGLESEICGWGDEFRSSATSRSGGLS
jgi:hypothetical protein